jgi:hypothetical protein
MLYASQCVREHKLTKAERLAIAAAALTVLTLIAMSQFVSSAQQAPLQPGFGYAITAVNQAEAAGATRAEIAPLVNLLNNALELDHEAQQTLDQSARTQLLSQVDQILTTVENQAKMLTAASSQRTQSNHLFSYVVGVLAALVGTIVYALAALTYRKYRIKRTLQMRIRAK